jgi:hypothetical protein
MSKVVLDVSMSLDGFSAGPNVREAEPMGDGGERLQTSWYRAASWLSLLDEVPSPISRP